MKEHDSILELEEGLYFGVIGIKGEVKKRLAFQATNC